MRSSTTSHKNQLYRRSEDKNNCYRELNKQKLLLIKISELDRKLQRNNQKYLVFHAEAKQKKYKEEKQKKYKEEKQKKYKEEKKLRKSCEASSFLLQVCVLGKYYSLVFSSQILFSILIQIINLDFCIFGSFTKVNTSFIPSTLKT